MMIAPSRETIDPSIRETVIWPKRHTWRPPPPPPRGGTIVCYGGRFQGGARVCVCLLCNVKDFDCLLAACGQLLSWDMSRFKSLHTTWACCTRSAKFCTSKTTQGGDHRVLRGEVSRWGQGMCVPALQCQRL